MISYSKIFQQAWVIAKQQRFLWWYGLLLFSGVIIDMYGAVTSPEASAILPEINRFNPEVLFDFRHAPLVILVLFCVWVVVYYRSKAGIILSVTKILDKQPVGFKQTFVESKKYFVYLVGLSVTTQLTLLVLSALIFSPVYYLSAQGEAVESRILAITGGLLFAAFAFVITFTGIFGAINIVALKMRFVESIRAAVDLVGNFWKQLIFIGLLVLGGILLSGMISSLLAAPFVVFGVLSYHSGGLSAVSALLFFTALAVFWAVSGWFNAFYNTLWVVFFSTVVRTPKTETDETIPEAEIAQ